MKIKRILYRRKFNLGDYENEDLELEGELEEDDDIKEEFKKLKKQVENLQRGE